MSHRYVAYAFFSLEKTTKIISTHLLTLLIISVIFALEQEKSTPGEIFGI